MKQYLIKKSMLHLIIVLFSIYSAGCSSNNLINDFFGIQMNLSQEKNFKIVSYNESDGIKYQSSVVMNPKINAWAEISVDEARVKIVNNSPREIPLNYNYDQYIIITDEKEYVLEKGNRMDYFSTSTIEPNSSFELRLKLPNDYVNDATSRYEFKSRSKLAHDMLRDFSKFGKTADVNKENVKYIIIKLGDRTIVLKRVPDDQ